MQTKRTVVSISCLLMTLAASCATRKFGEKSTSSSASKLDRIASLANYNGSIICPQGAYAEASNETEVQDVIKLVRGSGKTVRVVSQEKPHSYSTVICPTDGGVVLNLHKLNKIIAIDTTSSVPTATVEPGVRIIDLQEELHKQGYAFPVTPDYNDVTLAGATATGAHHSSLSLASGIADWTEEMTVINGKGERQVFSGKELDPVRVHLGLLGAVVQLKMRIVPQFKLRFGVSRFDDSKLSSELSQQIAGAEYAKASWFPTNNEYVLETFEKVPVTEKGDSFSTTWTAIPDTSILGDLPNQVLNASKFASCTAEFVRTKTFGGFFKVIDSPRKNPVGFSHKMLAGNCRGDKCPWETGTKSRTVEVAFPLADFPKWVSDVRSILDARQACFINGLYLRFSKASKGALAQAFQEDSAIFEIHIVQNKEPGLEKWSDVYDEIVQMTLAKYKGRPHWAKNSTPYFVKLGAAQYPQWNDFEAIRTRMDPDGLFVSSLWASINQETKGESTLPTAPNCAVTRSCICSTDAQCGSGAKCVPGGFFQDARVCRK
ncbi:MAG: FAD-binding protein [Silvanigrellales bacterium]|nr:FAD-binding protein [Silvanigrellales bacterium]